MALGKTKPTISLHRAAEDGDLEQVRANLACGVDLNGRDRDKMTPLHHAVFNGHEDIASLLLDKGADVNAKGQEGDVCPLHLAAVRSNRDIVELLLNRGADVHAEDRYGRKPLHYAKSFNQIQIMDLLLEYENR